MKAFSRARQALSADISMDRPPPAFIRSLCFRRFWRGVIALIVTMTASRSGRRGDQTLRGAAE
jgi:hypothetical protein